MSSNPSVFSENVPLYVPSGLLHGQSNNKQTRALLQSALRDTNNTPLGACACCLLSYSHSSKSTCLSFGKPLLQHSTSLTDITEGCSAWALPHSEATRQQSKSRGHIAMLPEEAHKIVLCYQTQGCCAVPCSSSAYRCAVNVVQASSEVQR